MLKRFSISWLLLALFGCRNVARIDMQQIDFCTFSSFILYPHTFHRCMNFCFKENRIYPFKNLYGDIQTLLKISELYKYNNNYRIYWDNNNYRFFIIYFILLIIIIYYIYKKFNNYKYKKNLQFIKRKYYQKIEKNLINL